MATRRNTGLRKRGYPVGSLPKATSRSRKSGGGALHLLAVFLLLGVSVFGVVWTVDPEPIDRLGAGKSSREIVWPTIDFKEVEAGLPLREYEDGRLYLGPLDDYRYEFDLESQMVRFGLDALPRGSNMKSPRVGVPSTLGFEEDAWLTSRGASTPRVRLSADRQGALGGDKSPLQIARAAGGKGRRTDEGGKGSDPAGGGQGEGDGGGSDGDSAPPNQRDESGPLSRDTLDPDRIRPGQTSVPEPSSLLLLLTGLAGVGLLARRKG